ncbi:hypothetical protein Y1Q_0004003 [Alligator mississippiensis]|uniref:Uncharacterized protein n=1 Tax=Alligator mississippiensis TaxID=8496 RepID=A0A151PHL4_ALLMI|nr:hypothetical protein Y1Q_0004003 [Alligator mississippiensis]
MERSKMENEGEICHDGEQRSEESSDMENMEDMELMTIRRRYRYPEDLEYTEESEEVEFDWARLRNLRSTRIRMVWACKSSLDWSE